MHSFANPVFSPSILVLIISNPVPILFSILPILPILLFIVSNPVPILLFIVSNPVSILFYFVASAILKL